MTCSTFRPQVRVFTIQVLPFATPQGPGQCQNFTENFKENRKDLYKWTIDQTPMGRWGKCEEMANIASFMISEQNSYMTGTTIYSDGGWTAK